MVFFLTLGLLWAGYDPGDIYTYGGAVPAALHLMLAAAPAALVVALVWFAIAYVFNEAIIEFATGSKAVTREQEPQLYNCLENLCISRGLNMPKLRVIETEGMNAFASGLHEGRFNVTVTRGLLQHLDRDELEAVLAHELTHILNRDVRTMVIAAVFAGIITLICQIIYRTILWGGSWGGRSRRGNLGVFFLVAIVVAAVGYLLAIVIRMAISRTREYVADAGSVELTKNPDAMISALQKVAGHTHLDAPQSMRAMFLEDDDEGIMGLFATHPPVGKRIEALMRYGGGRAAEPKPAAAAPSTAAPVTPQSAPSDGPWGAPAGGEPGPWS